MNRAIFAMLLGLSLAGCTVRPPVEGRKDVDTNKQIFFDSVDLKDATAVGEPQVSRDPNGGILYIMVPFRSEIGQDLHVDYRASFFKNGQLMSQTGWFTRTFTSKVPDQITINSMAPGATDFRVEFRWAR